MRLALDVDGEAIEKEGVDFREGDGSDDVLE